MTLIGNFNSLYDYLVEDPKAPYDLLHGLAALGAIAAIPFVWCRFGAAYAAFMIFNLALPLSTGHLDGLGRYAAVLFPIYLWLATLKSPLVQAGILAAFGMLYMLCQALFVNLHPIF